MDSVTLQADEVEALKSIYGEDLVVNERDHTNLWIDLKVSSEEKCVSRHESYWDRHIRLEVTLPADYPLTAPPSYTISAPWMSRNKKLQLTSAMEDIYVDNAGDSILYMWIEKARQFLTEGLVDLPDDEEYYSENGHTENLADRMTLVSPTNESAITERQEIHMDHGEVTSDRKSRFQAHLARVTRVDDAKRTIRQVMEHKKFSTATHNISAYRISGGPHGTCFQDCDDDGESQAGSRLLHLMQILDVKDVVVIVSRWFGGTQLGADRFKHINNVARDLLIKCQVVPCNETAVTAKDSRKKKGK